MKKTLLYISASLLMVSCSLKEDRDSYVQRDNAYGTYLQCQSVLNSCYLNLKSIYVSSFSWAVESCTDLWYVTTSTPDCKCQISPSKPGIGKTVWSQCYQGVMRCNEFIECMSAKQDIGPDYASMIAEARGLRALYYYDLTCMFGDVPFYLYMVKDLPTQEKVRLLPRTDANEIRDALIEDLQKNVLSVLPRIRTCEVPQDRAGYSLAQMLIAKFAMWNAMGTDGWNGYWKTAEDALSDIESIYGEFNEEKYPLDDTRWCKKNTPESIFELQHEWQANGIQFAGSMCRTYYPGNIAQRWDNKDVTDGVTGNWIPDLVEDGYLDDVYMPQWGTEIPFVAVMHGTFRLGCFVPAGGTAQKESTSATYFPGDRLFDPLPMTYGEFNKKNNRWNTRIDTLALETGVSTRTGEKIDRRIRYVLGMGELTKGAVSYGETFKDTRTSFRVYAGEKFWVPDMVSNYDSNNYKLFRYADAILMMAEVKCMKTDGVKESLRYLNKVRARAGVAPFDGISDKEAVIKLIQDERGRELAGELHRKFDLVRWGIWYETTLKYTPSATKNYLQAYIQPYHKFYPIPDTECALSVGPDGNRVLTNPDYQTTQID